MRLWLLFLVSVLLCQASTIGANEEAEAAAIRQEYEDWAHACEQKDLDRTMEIFAPEVISIFAGGTDNNLDAIRHSYENTFAAVGSPRQWKPRDMEIRTSGDLAYVLADWQLVEDGSVRRTNRSIDALRREGQTWKIIRELTIPQDARTVNPSCDVTLPNVSPPKFTGAARDVWQTLMRWRDAYNSRDLSGTLEPYDPSITGLYAGNPPDTLATLREAYTRSFAIPDRQRTIDFEPEEIL